MQVNHTYTSTRERRDIGTPLNLRDGLLRPSTSTIAATSNSASGTPTIATTSAQPIRPVSHTRTRIVSASQERPLTGSSRPNPDRRRVPCAPHLTAEAIRRERHRRRAHHPPPNIPYSLLGYPITVLPASAVEVTVVFPRQRSFVDPLRTPPSRSIPLEEAPPRIPRSSRTFFNDQSPQTPTRSSNRSSRTSRNSARESVMISFNPTYPTRTQPLPPLTDFPFASSSTRSHHVAMDQSWPTNPLGGPLQVGVKVVLDQGTNRIEMIGGPRTGTAYSLAGHVVLTVPNLPPSGGCPDSSWKNRKREIKRLRMKFEGKSEFHDESGRYHATQLCRVEKDILVQAGSSHLLEHSSSSSSSSAYQDATTYTIAFDMTIPGWLPATFHNDMSATLYGLVCDAELGWANELDSAGSPSLTSSGPFVRPEPILSSAPIPIGNGFSVASRFLPRLAKTVATAFGGWSYAQYSPDSVKISKSEWQTVTVVRHRAQPTTFISTDLSGDRVAVSVDPAHIPLRHFTLKPSADSPSPIECVVSTPEIVDLNGPSLRVSVRLRARKVPSLSLTSAGSAVAGAVPAGFMRSSDENGDVSMDDASDDTPRNDSGSSSRTCTPLSPIKEAVRMIELGMELEEIEKYSSLPAQSYTSTFPIPENQPNLHSASTDGFLSPPSQAAKLHMFGISPSSHSKACRSRTLLLSEDGATPRTYRFEDDGLELGSGWRKVNIVIPLPSQESSTDIALRPLAETENPYVRLKHKLKIRLICKTASAVGAETVVCLTTPLRVGTSVPPVRRSPFAPSHIKQYLTPLPAYNQIFHENGATREDDDPLPLYEEPEAPQSILLPSAQGPPAFRRISSPAREAMDLDDRAEVLRTVTNLREDENMEDEPMPSSFDRRNSGTATPPEWATAVPSLYHSPVSSSFQMPTTSFGSVPGPRTPRSVSPSSFEEPSGLAFTAGSPNSMAETFGLGSLSNPSRDHEITRHQMITRAKASRTLDLVHTEETL